MMVGASVALTGIYSKKRGGKMERLFSITELNGANKMVKRFINKLKAKQTDLPSFKLNDSKALNFIYVEMKAVLREMLEELERLK